MLSNYENVKKFLGIKLVNIEANREKLKNVPWVRVLDLAKVYVVVLTMDDSGMCTATVNNRLLRNWGVDLETLAADAEAAMKERFGCRILEVEELLLELSDMRGENNQALRDFIKTRRELLDETGDFKGHLFVLTNDVRINGAACLTFKDVIESFGEKIGRDFYVIPSSIHEVLLLPFDAEADSGEIESLIGEVNETQLSPEEVLSNNLYFYHREKGELMFAREDGDQHYAA